jgi:fumarate reductase subunit C
VTIWLIWLLVEVGRLRLGPAGYHPHMNLAFVIFSAFCFVFAMLHSITFLMLSGVVLSIPIGGLRPSPALIRAANFGLWLVISVVIIAGWAYLGSLS